MSDAGSVIVDLRPVAQPAEVDLVRLTEAERQACRLYHAENRSFPGVAHALGVSENRARQLVRSAEAKLDFQPEKERPTVTVTDPAGVKPSPAYRDWTPEEDERLLSLRGQHTHKEIAAMLDRTPGAVSARFNALGAQRNGAASPPPPAPALPTPPPEGVLPPVTPRPEPPPVGPDREIAALTVIHAHLAGLSAGARHRVLRWLGDRFSSEEAEAPR